VSLSSTEYLFRVVLFLTTTAGETKLPVPKMIIPAVGGDVTSAVISKQQVAAVTNIDPASVISQANSASDDVYDGQSVCLSVFR